MAERVGEHGREGGGEDGRKSEGKMGERKGEDGLRKLIDGEGARGWGRKGRERGGRWAEVGG